MAKYSVQHTRTLGFLPYSKVFPLTLATPDACFPSVILMPMLLSCRAEKEGTAHCTQKIRHWFQLRYVSFLSHFKKA